MSGEIALNTGSVSTKGETTSTISLFKESESSYECLVVPQSTAYSLKIILTTEGGEELVFEHTVSSAQSFVSGYQYNLPVQLSIESKMTKALVSDVIVSEWTTTNLDTIAGKIECDDNSSEHEYVDLGLPSGTLWATCNVGAESPSDYGDYFAWGETTSKSTYNWETYKYGGENALTKYCTYSSYGKDGFTDDKNSLETTDDAATANWGKDWVMPTDEQFQELIDNCDLEWTSIGGVNGYKVMRKDDNTKYLFLPAAGGYFGSELTVAGEFGGYWSSSLCLVDDYGGPLCAEQLNFNSDEVDGHPCLHSTDRMLGSPIRPVRSKKGEYEYVDLGLPSGTLWATCNVGADSPSDYGDYFAWGETVPKEKYNWETYKYGNDNTKLTKYCTNPDAGKDGYTDNLTTLKPEDDAATVNWGEEWRMPTKDEIKELGENCNLQTTSINGVSGLKISNRNDDTKYIFLPKGGEYSGSQKSDEDKIYYWTSSLNSGLFPGNAYMLARNNFTGLLSQRYKGC